MWSHNLGLFCRENIKDFNGHVLYSANMATLLACLLNVGHQFTVQSDVPQLASQDEVSNCWKPKACMVPLQKRQGVEPSSRAVCTVERGMYMTAFYQPTVQNSRWYCTVTLKIDIYRVVMTSVYAQDNPDLILQCMIVLCCQSNTEFLLCLTTHAETNSKHFCFFCLCCSMRWS